MILPLPGLSVIEYGMGNIQSVLNACARVGAEAKTASSGEQLLAQHADRILLPGVGAVGETLHSLRQRGFISALQSEVIERNVPFVGICVGMQILADVCEEFGEHPGLGWIPGRVERLAPIGTGVRLPHVGWNTIHVSDTAPDLNEFDGQDFYFQHSFAMRCPAQMVVAESDYVARFVSAVRSGHITGVQFHPEKSAAAGIRLLGRLLQL